MCYKTYAAHRGSFVPVLYAFVCVCVCVPYFVSVLLLYLYSRPCALWCADTETESQNLLQAEFLHRRRKLGTGS